MSALLAVAVETAAADDDFFYRIDAGRLACIAEHLDTYLTAGGEILYIEPAACPPERAPDLGNVVRNEAPDIRFSEDGELDPLLVLLPDQLRCLAGFGRPGPASVLRFYPETCAVEVDR